jgi:hypothetical protein
MARRSHLLDPNNLPKPSPRAQQSLSNVQRWVMSSLAVTTIAHLVAGLIIAAWFIEEARTDARVGLLVIAGAFGAIAIAAFRAIHQKSIASPWLALGAIPSAAVAFWMF